MAEKLEQITVVAKRGKDKKAHDRVVLWEQNPEHPTGEVYVVRDGNPVDVALTPGVKSLLGNGDLEKVDKVVAVPKPTPVKADDGDDDEKDAIPSPLPSGVNRGGRPPRLGVK